VEKTTESAGLSKPRKNRRGLCLNMANSGADSRMQTGRSTIRKSRKREETQLHERKSISLEEGTV